MTGAGCRIIRWDFVNTGKKRVRTHVTNGKRVTLDEEPVYLLNALSRGLSPQALSCL
jgi:hypothetical protein